MTSPFGPATMQIKRDSEFKLGMKLVRKDNPRHKFEVVQCDWHAGRGDYWVSLQRGDDVVWGWEDQLKLDWFLPPKPARLVLVDDKRTKQRYYTLVQEDP